MVFWRATNSCRGSGNDSSGKNSERRFKLLLLLLLFGNVAVEIVLVVCIDESKTVFE